MTNRVRCSLLDFLGLFISCGQNKCTVSWELMWIHFLPAPGCCQPPRRTAHLGWAQRQALPHGPMEPAWGFVRNTVIGRKVKKNRVKKKKKLKLQPEQFPVRHSIITQVYLRHWRYGDWVDKKVRRQSLMAVFRPFLPPKKTKMSFLLLELCSDGSLRVGWRFGGCLLIRWEWERFPSSLSTL